MHDDRALTDRDYRRLADLHRATMPTSVMGRLGPSLLAHYYRWVAGSGSERLFVVRHGEDIAGAAVVSDAPQTVASRFASSGAVTFAAALLKSTATDAAFRHDLWAYLRETVSGRNEAPHAPELTQIFVAPDWQDRSLGTTLLTRVEVDLRRRGIADYYARTVVKENGRTLAFYERRAFTRVGEVRFCGQLYALLRKSVPSALERG